MYRIDFMKYSLFVLLLWLAPFCYGQNDTITPVKNDSLQIGVGKVEADTIPKQSRDSLKVLMRKIGKSKAPKDTIRITHKDYKIISHQRDTVLLDTSLSIKKHYRFNFLRKDDFELMPFANMGQGYVSLTGDYKENNRTYAPFIGAKAKHHHYMNAEDVQYYNVPIPTSEAMFKTSVDQGQYLNIFITFNNTKRFNFSIENTGFRSQGKYKYEDATGGNFRITSNYQTKNLKYQVRTHFVGQTSDVEESGGMAKEVEQFESADERFIDRKIIDLNFTTAKSYFVGKRYFIDQEYLLSRSPKDSLSRKSKLVLGHRASYESRFVHFTQNTNEFFGESDASKVNDMATLQLGKQQFSSNFTNPILGSLKALVEWDSYKYHFRSTQQPDSLNLNRIDVNELVVGGVYQKSLGGFSLKGDLKYTLAGSLTGYELRGELASLIKKKHRFSVDLHLKSRMPDFNYLLYASDYTNYQWNHLEDFEKEKTNSLSFKFDSSLLGKLDASVSLIDNFTYLSTRIGEADSLLTYKDFNKQLKPFQTEKSVKHLKVKYQRELRLGKWALDNTIMYQQVVQSEDALFVPEIISRNTLYFSSDVFDHAMYLQTGVSFKYFSEYRMNGYNPLMGEFFTRPDATKYGGYPLIDFFINARVRQTRFFFKAEHLNAPFTGYKYYTAPGYPYRDFTIRFGLVWDFFS